MSRRVAQLPIRAQKERMEPIFQSALPYSEADRRALPGVAPLDPGNWLLQDDAFAAQMALRARLIAERRGDVIALLPEGQAAAQELLSTVLAQLADARAYRVGKAEVLRPDAVTVVIDRADPLATLGHLVQEDLCLLQRPDEAAEHLLTGAVLCFPSAWTLAQKIGRPMMRIHDPVPDYDAGIGKRVQRMLDGVQAGRPLWRFNWLPTDDTALFRPMLEYSDKIRRAGLPYLRSERQTLWRLPKSGAVVFGIHTYLVRIDDL
ncbi:DUF3445 domain-containing protein [Pseudooceanicola sp.]|uniref:heme-dependent oxidative N-demethylase family protein n=1 Tax=Pseudooceanicola sp. TaxID=1914328 RepID=UPI0026251D93|nr:DUF3445 domain-containing protein [Pseudooceanicola sp.]MDF1854759.1 DUF3445 domain-containing protein [Pseudooceanicola sp.]